MDKESNSFHRQWFKFFGQDWLTDLKIINMSVEDRLCYISLLCLASQSENGLVTKCNEAALLSVTHLRDDVYDNENSEYVRAQGCLKRFAELGMIDLLENGDVFIKAFERRQKSILSGAERQKIFRERRRNDSVTPHVTKVTLDKNRIDKNRIDNNKDKEATPGVAGSKELQINLNPLIEKFKGVNPNYENLFKNTTQRSALERLVKKHTFEKISSLLDQLPEIVSQKFAPRITTPLTLEAKLGDLVLFYKQQQSQAPKDKLKVHIMPIKTNV